jgi:proteasome beta subunit
MTVIVGYVSRAGAVMASDSQSAEEDATTSQIDKIWRTGRLLLGYSGQLAIREPLRRDIERRLQESPLPAQVPIEIAASMLCAIVRPVLEQAYANFVGAPGDDPADKLAGSLMVIGYDGERYWLLEIDRHNTPSHYTEEGFHTIGTGSVAAHVSRGLLKHYSLPGHEVKQFRLLAYRTVETCIDVLGGAYGLGPPVQLWQSTPDGFEKVIGEELSSVSEGVRQWIGIEQESLDRVFAQEEEPVAEEPLPERLDEPE